MSGTDTELEEPRAQPQLSFYQVLGLQPSAPPEMIETAYRILLSELEARGGDPHRRQAIEDAHRVLSDPTQRAAYDRVRGFGEPRGLSLASPAPVKAGAIPIRRTVGEAWHVVTGYPRDSILPMLAVQAPVALLSSVVVTVLYLTVFSDHEVRTLNDLLDDGPSGPLFVILVAMAVQALFTQVARGATILSVAGIIQGNRRSLSASLDPAFTRMGGLLVLALTLALMGAALAVTLIGLVLLPYLALRAFLTFEAFMLEGVSPLRAIGRSWRLMSGNLIRLLGTLLLWLLFAIGPLILISTLGTITGGSRTQEVLLSGAMSFVQAIVLVPLFAFFTAVTTIFYLRAKANEDARTAARV